MARLAAEKGRRRRGSYIFLAQVSRRPCHRLNVISHRSMSSNNFQGTRRDNSGRIIKIIISKEDGG